MTGDNDADDRARSRRGRPAVSAASLVVYLQLANFVAAVTCGPAAAAAAEPFGRPPAHAVDLTELKRNIITGLKLEKLPDMTKVDISNDEFHCKYLEYFRRLYATAADDSEYDNDDDDGDGGDDDDDDDDDATATASPGYYDNDDGVVSATQVRGRVEHRSGSGDGDDEDNGPRSSTDDVDGDEERVTIAFPIDRVTVRGGRAKVIKSVARIYGGGTASRVRVRVYGHLSDGGGRSKRREKPSLVADLTWPAAAGGGGGGGRWTDVDVTRLMRSRKRHGDGDATALELSVRYPAAVARTFGVGDRTPDDGGPLPVLHVFREGAADGTTTTTTTTTCPGDARRKKRDGGGGRRGGGKRRRPASTGLVRRTDCKAETSTAAAAGHNGTAEHGATNKCCREQMRVVFADIPGFDFIVEPKWFDAGLCRGRCPAKYNPATRHAFIQSLLWKQHNGRGGDRERAPGRSRRRVRHGGDGPSAAAAAAAARTPQPPPKPCCAPSKLDRLQIIHVDEMDPSSLKVTTWKEMSVVECACS